VGEHQISGHAFAALSGPCGPFSMASPIPGGLLTDI